MNIEEHLGAIARDGTAIPISIAAAGFDARVSACPDWSAGDLLWHVTHAYYFWDAVIEQQVSDWTEVGQLDRVPDDQLLAEYDRRFDGLCRTLADIDPAKPIWTWSSDNTAGFVIRRMAHETSVHRWDADDAAGSPAAIDAELASDGIDEFLVHFLPLTMRAAAFPFSGSVHIHCADVPGEWTVRPSATGVGFDVTREHAKGDCALRGAASDLVLALWRRVGLDAIDVVGDSDVAARFLAATPPP